MKDSQETLLFTPGPLNTNEATRRAMLSDIGSREPEFIALVRSIREDLLSLAELRPDSGYEAVLMQGSGTFGIESVVGTIVPRDGKLLVLVNGAYGRRIVQIAQCLEIEVSVLESDETELPDLEDLAKRLAEDTGITHVAAVHCETTSGILNPIEAIAELVHRHRRTLLVDAMSSFGGIPLDLRSRNIHFLISSANKCLEGVPGFSFIIADRAKLDAARGNARSVSLDLVAQWDGFEANGQFRFTPPTHALLAFRQALRELHMEGGIEARHRRYRDNCNALVEGMEQLGFSCLLRPDLRSPVITTFLEPEIEDFEFDTLYRALADQGLIIYPGKLTRTPSFRIGSIGNLDRKDMVRLIDAIGDSLRGMTGKTA